MQLDRDARVFVAGQSGLVGGALLRKLHDEGFTNMLTSTCQELNRPGLSEASHWSKANRPEYVYLVAARSAGSSPADAAGVVHLRHHDDRRSDLASDLLDVKRFAAC